MISNNPILLSISDWFGRTFSDPEALSLFFTLVFGLLFLEFFGQFFMPVIVSIVIAYLLMAPVRLLERCRFPRALAVWVIYLFFISAVALVLLLLLPSLWKQFANLLTELPRAMSHSQIWFAELHHRYPKVLSDAQVAHVVVILKNQLAKVGQWVLTYSLAIIPNVIQLIIYFILVPLLLFFFLKDSQDILSWSGQYLPRKRGLMLTVWYEVNLKMGGYVRGRVAEVIIVSLASSITFYFLGLQYAVLLGFLFGLSAIIPYVGGVLITIPIVIIGLMQWGLSSHFFVMIVLYGLIYALDGYILVPFLFADIMELHPLVIILSVITFGGLWGFWGIFFAIPLATLINIVLKSWPQEVTS